MATAITVRSESADYYTKAFSDHEGLEEIYNFLVGTSERIIYLVGFDCTNKDITEKDIGRLICDAEDANE